MYIYIYNLLVNLYMQLTISSCYGLIRLTLGLKGGDGGLSTQCHTCRFTCQQRVLKVKTFPVLTMKFTTFTSKFAYIYIYTYN